MLIVLVALLCAGPVWGHRVRVFAVAQGRKVLCRGYSSGGDALKDCRITAELPDGTVVAEGRTDENGEFTFEATQRAELKIVLDAGAGHRAEYTLRAEDLPAELPATAGEQAGPQTEPLVQEGAPSDARADTSSVALDERRLKGIVRSVVQEEMLGLRGDLRAAEDRGPGVTEIVGGIGYIVGITGLVMYMRIRRKISKD